jgi:hypothetical protein
MRLIQFTLPDKGRRVGLVEKETVHDLTATQKKWTHLYHIFREAREAERTVEEHIRSLLKEEQTPALPYKPLWENRPGDDGGWLLPPLDHPDPAHCIIGGTGLTHTGSMAQRDAMHEDQNAEQTDSEKMFAMGLEGGNPAPGERGIAPECFYKGSGVIMRPHNGFLDIPSFAKDGGEEPEIVGCYVIGEDGTPYRLGFAIGNEWSDHAMEQINYLWLAPSKLRTCGIGPELITDHPFQDIRGSCCIYRQSETIYECRELLTGEEHMSHSLANLEDHHFKHPQFRMPGDVHLYFFGTSEFSFGSRGPLADDDRVEIQFSGMGAPLINYVRKVPDDSTPITVHKG